MTDTTPPPALVFIDTETTSLRPDRLVWEVAWIRRDAVAGAEEGMTLPRVTDGHLFVEVPLDNADPIALKVGRYHERIENQVVQSEAYVAKAVDWATRGAVLIGSNPSFDTECLAAMLRRHGHLPGWQYRTVDVITLAAGFLAGATDPDVDPDDVELARTLPYKSEQLAQALGVEVTDDDRHTAFGDARWAMRVWDAVMGS